MGPDGVLQGAKPGTILIDMSTVDPETTRAVSKAAAEKDIQYLDAPVSGGYREAESGSLVIIVGGDRSAFEKAKEVLAVLALGHSLRGAVRGREHRQAHQQRHVDGQRSGRRGSLRARREGRHGRRRRLFDIIRTSAGRSYHFERRFPNILARNFAPGFTVDLARKDLGLAVDMARSARRAGPGDEPDSPALQCEQRPRGWAERLCLDRQGVRGLGQDAGEGRAHTGELLISIKSFPRTRSHGNEGAPLEPHLLRHPGGSSGGMKCESTSVFTPAACRHAPGIFHRECGGRGGAS